MAPSGLKIPRPNSLTTELYADPPGIRTSCPSLSASISLQPRRSKAAPTKLFPLARPPVNPTFSIIRGYVGWGGVAPAGSRSYTFIARGTGGEGKASQESKRQEV